MMQFILSLGNHHVLNMQRRHIHPSVIITNALHLMMRSRFRCQPQSNRTIIYFLQFITYPAKKNPMNCSFQ